MDEQDRQDEQGEQLELLTPNEVADREVATILGRHGLVGIDGKPDMTVVGDLLEPTIHASLVNVPGERTKQTVWADDLMERHFPEVPGRATWIDQDDPTVAELVFKKVRTVLVRVLNTSPRGELQARFAANGGLVLCEHSPARKGGSRGFYVTRNPKCITEDLANPARQAALSANNRYAALAEMAIDRVPEHARKFSRDFNEGQRQITDGPKTVVRAALATATAADTGENDIEIDADGNVDDE